MLQYFKMYLGNLITGNCIYGKINGHNYSTYRIFPLLARFARFPVADKVVQGPVFNQSSENEKKANRDKQIHRSHIGNFGKGFTGNCTQCGHCQDSCDSCEWTNRKNINHRTICVEAQIEYTDIDGEKNSIPT